MQRPFESVGRELKAEGRLSKIKLYYFTRRADGARGRAPRWCSRSREYNCGYQL